MSTSALDCLSLVNSSPLVNHNLPLKGQVVKFDNAPHKNCKSA